MAIEDICFEIRGILDRILESADIQCTAGTCLYASILLAKAISKFGNCDARICGGDGLNDGGLLGTDSKWHGHYWVELTLTTGERFIADITGDQFGFAPVIVVPISIGRSRYRPGDQEAVDLVVGENSIELSPKDRQVPILRSHKLA